MTLLKLFNYTSNKYIFAVYTLKYTQESDSTQNCQLSTNMDDTHIKYICKIYFKIFQIIYYLYIHAAQEFCHCLWI